MFRWCICQGSPEKQNQYNVCVCLSVCVFKCVCVCIDRYQERKRKVEIEMFKDLAHMIMEAGKSKICKVGWRPGEELIFLRI